MILRSQWGVRITYCVEFRQHCSMDERIYHVGLGRVVIPCKICRFKKYTKRCLQLLAVFNLLSWKSLCSICFHVPFVHCDRGYGP